MNASLPPQVAAQLDRTLNVPRRPLLTRSGWAMFLFAAGSLAEAVSMARGTMGRSAQITMLHHPPILMTDVI